MSASERSIGYLNRLIGFQSITRESNLDLIEWVSAELRLHGIASRLVHDDSGRKANLYARVGPEDQAGIMLSGHTDVVPVAGQPWTSDPFRALQRDGAIYGRGACDMKGYIACALSAMIDASEATLQRPLHLALSYDEEIGCVGVRRLLDVLPAMRVRPTMCIIGEPTSMRIGLGHKGKAALRALCCGTAGHSALSPRFLNAIHLAADLVKSIQSVQEQVRQSGAMDSDYDIPYSTLHVGHIDGGKALNIVPEQCAIDFEIRHLAQDDPDAILGAVQAKAERIRDAARENFPEADIVIERLNSYPGLNTHPTVQAVRFVEGLLGDDATRIKVAFGTEGGLFEQKLGIPVVVCGPGSIEQAHKADEFIELSQLGACDEFLKKLVGSLC